MASRAHFRHGSGRDADTDTARAIAQSARPDCRKASGDSTAFNIFGLIPLAYATVTDTGCKW